MSFRCWERRFGAAPDVIGKVVQINRIHTTIVGVTPQGFDGTMQAGESPDFFVPLARHLLFQPGRAARAQPSYWWIRIMGRLAPGMTAAQARASLEPPFQSAARDGRLATRPADGKPDDSMPGLPTLAADPGAQGENDVRQQFARPLQLLMGLVSLVLAAACANVANLLLARHVARRREIGLRLALGASRGRIVRQLLIESLLLAFSGAAIGAALAWWSRGLLLALRPFGHAAVALDLPIDLRVLVFTVVVAVLTALVFGLVPALRATRVDLAAEVQSGARTLGNHWRSRLNQALMVVQIALSLVLLVSTGLFVRSLGKLQNVDAGFDRRDLVLFTIDATSAGYTGQRAAALQARLQESLAQAPGVRAVTFSSVALLSAVRQNKRVTIPGHAPQLGTSMIVNTNGLAPNFFETMALPLVAGRGFTVADDETTARVAVVNQAFVRTYFDRANPVGHRIRVGQAATDDVEVVGVARDAKYTELRGAAPATIYFPAFQRVDGTANFAVRLAPQATTRGSAATASVESAIRTAVHEIDPVLPVLNLRTQDEQIDRLNAQPLLFARLSGLFGLLALALALVGLYGLMSYAVARRVGEIGIRAALGAAPAGVRRMILRESLWLVFLGIMLRSWRVRRRPAGRHDALWALTHRSAHLRLGRGRADRRHAARIMASRPACEPHRSDRRAERRIDRSCDFRWWRRRESNPHGG